MSIQPISSALNGDQYPMWSRSPLSGSGAGASQSVSWDATDIVTLSMQASMAAAGFSIAKPDPSGVKAGAVGGTSISCGGSPGSDAAAGQTSSLLGHFDGAALLADPASAVAPSASGGSGASGPVSLSDYLGHGFTMNGAS